MLRHLKWEGPHLANPTPLPQPLPQQTADTDRQAAKKGRETGRGSKWVEDGLTSRVKVWSQITGKPHGCSSPCCSWCLWICQLWQLDTQAAQSRALQAERAVELHRPWARPLTLCLLRMKREDFITSCRPRLHPSCLPPPEPYFPSYPLLLPSLYLPASLPHSQPVAYVPGPVPAKRGEADCQRKPPIPWSACAARCTERERQGGRWRDRVMAYIVWICHVSVQGLCCGHIYFSMTVLKLKNDW